MARLLEILLVAASVLCSAGAQNASSPAPLPPAMRAAIDRLSAGTQPTTIFLMPANNEPRVNALPKVCSVPLLEMQIDHPERFTIRKVEPPAIHDALPLTGGPAPPCARVEPSNR